MDRRRTAVVAGVALAGVAGAGAVALGVRPAPGQGRAGDGAPAATAPVVSTDVARRQTVAGALGRSGTYTVSAPGPGTLTWVPAAGAVVGRGQPAYEVDGAPVILLFGERPPWRAMQSGMSDGVDVRQLEENLRALGYGAGLTVDEHFTSATYSAVRRWQQDAHLPVTGTVPLGQVVFVAGSVRVAEADLRAGAAVEPGAVVEHGTSEQRAVTAQVSTAVLARIKVGDAVVVTLPDGTVRPGTISTLGAVTQAAATNGGPPGQSGGGPASVGVVVTMNGSVGNVLEDAQVQVGFTVEAHRGVLAVPIPALRALPNAEYEVLVADGANTRHVSVRVGIFDQVASLVEVTGDGLAAGQRVAVPN
ncbi:peptidoglycan-binding protein [Dactylosporangium sp. CA-139066]|uniref:peptidoglycan-binding protein n=1 Tax=Dactylosporangium sp. CA-139066 TaxID=3239930 RepID=UPI003D91400C